MSAPEEINWERYAKGNTILFFIIMHWLDTKFFILMQQITDCRAVPCHGSVDEDICSVDLVAYLLYRTVFVCRLHLLGRFGGNVMSL